MGMKELQELAMNFYERRDEKSFNTLYREMKPLAKRLLKKRILLLEPNDILEEIYNVGMVSIWRGIETYKGDKSSITTWMISCILNDGKGYVRSKSRKPIVRKDINLMNIKEEEKDTYEEDLIETKEIMRKLSEIYPI